MRNSIIVSVSELRSLIQDVRRTGKTYVEVTISDSFEDDGETYPAELSLCTIAGRVCSLPSVSKPLCAYHLIS